MQSKSTLLLILARQLVRPQGSWFTSVMLLLCTAVGLTQSTFAQNPVPGPVPAELIGKQLPLAVLDGSARLTGRYNGNQMLRVVLALQPPHMQQEEQFLRDLQTKDSKEFHHYLTAEQWNARFAPTKQDEQAVVDWAQSQGLKVTNRYPNRLLVDVEAPASVLEKAFGVKINSYQIGTDTYFSNDSEPQLPVSLTSIVHSVQGMNNIQRMRPANQRASDPVGPDYAPGPVIGSGVAIHVNGDKKQRPAETKASHDKNKSSIHNITNGFYDPTDIYGSNAYDYNALYAQGHCCNPLGNPGSSPQESSIAIATFGSFNGADIVGFHAQYPYLAYNIQPIYIDGTPGCCNTETTLDMEYTTAMSNSFGSFIDTAKIWVYEGANFNNSTFTDMYNAMLNDGHARVFSTSWSCTEFYGCDGPTMDARHAIFDQMVGQGWTLVAASGDRGATDDCSHLSVAYPGTDPDVISIGGTLLSLFSDSTFFSETAWQGGSGAGSCSLNNGGSGGGCSAKFAAPGYQSSPACGAGSRSVPDISLNAAAGQNYYYGGLSGTGGTSIGAPEMAGFFAQENAYLLYENAFFVGNTCGNVTCAPMGNANYYLYYEGYNAPYAAHYPYYDITSGCNSNDITTANNTGYYCAGTGYDVVTGWGTPNTLQLAWSINTYLAGDFGAPNTTFFGPATNTWYNTDQIVSWSIADTSGNGFPATGVAGFSQAWDFDPGDAYSHSTPGQGDSFYSGPQFRNGTTGCLSFAGAGGCAAVFSQGCHTGYVRSWDNAGWGGLQTYGSICYDTIAPVTTDGQSPLPNGAGWNNSTVQVTLFPNDPGAGSTGSGILASYYAIDNPSCNPSNIGACNLYTGSVGVAAQGVHTFSFFSKDVAGNLQSLQSSGVNIDETAPVTGASVSGTTSVQVTLSASDALSGVASTVYQLDGGAVTSYGGPFTVIAAGHHTVVFHSTDRASNVEGNKSVNFTVLAKSTTALVSSLNPSTFGQNVTFTASVSPATATGTVTFKNGATSLGTINLVSGKAKLTTSALPAGSLPITAVYSGNSTIGGSSAALTQTVKKAATTTTLASSLNPSKKGQAVTLTATVAPGAGVTGTVTFKNGGTTLGTAPLNTTTHKAAITKSTLTVGTHSITAVYSGNANFNTSTSAVLKQVVK